MPGRARLRVPKPRTAEHVRRVAARVQRGKHVRRVDTNPATGGLLVTFAGEDPIDLIIDELKVAGLDVLTALESTRSVKTQSKGAVVVRQVFGAANAKLHEATGGKVDVRLAIPAVYLLLATRNFMRQRGRLRDASWYQLLYWAFDSFFKLHEEATVAGGAASGARR